MYYVFVKRFSPVVNTGVERWSLDNIRNFITRHDVNATSESKGITYENQYIKIFITTDMRDLALNEGNVIDF